MVASHVHEASTLNDYKDNVRRKIWTRPVACQDRCDGNSDAPEACRCQRDIVHVEALKQWWHQKAPGDSNQTNLQRVLQEMPLGDRLYPPNHKLFIGDRSCLMVFSLLLSQDRAYLVDIFSDSDIIDKHLNIVRDDSDQALRNNLKNIMHMQTEEVETVLKDFHNKRWEYCPLELTLHMSVPLHGTKVIPPFCHKIRKIDKGATASIYWVAVQKDFVTDVGLRCAIEQSLYEDEKYGECYQMILKTYCGNKKPVYELERATFTGLASNDEVPIVRYLGCYTHDYGDGSPLGRTYNLLLECGERDLYRAWEDETNVPPVRADEIIRFWKSLFEVAKAIHHIHGFELPQYGNKAPLKYVGWHADIKPDNILIIRGRLKLADFGYSKIARVAQQQNGSVHKEMMYGFTDTYGAPEVSRINYPDGTMSAVPQSIDIWSFGCVLSVAATWVVLGFQGVRQFVELRQRSPSSENDRFHDGFDVLPEIRKWHNYLRGHMRRSDTATASVLSLIENQMLQADTANRIDSGELCTTLRTILEEATAKVNSLLTHSKETDPAVSQALLSIEKQAQEEKYSKRRTTSAPVIDLNTLSPPEIARMQVYSGQMLKSRPLGQTPYRRQILEELHATTVMHDGDEIHAEGAHNSRFTDSPTYTFSPGDEIAVAPLDLRKPKPRNPNRNAEAITGHVATNKEMGPISSHLLQNTRQAEQWSQKISNATNPEPSKPERPNSLRDMYTASGQTPAAHDNSASLPDPAYALARPALTLDTPRHSRHGIDPHHPVPTINPPDTQAGLGENRPARPHHQHSPNAGTPASSSIAKGKEKDRQDNGIHWHADGPQWQASSQWHAEGPSYTAIPSSTQLDLYHGYELDQQNMYPSELETTPTPSRRDKFYADADEKQNVSTLQTSTHEPLPNSAYDLPYNVCHVRKELDQGSPKVTFARVKSMFGREDRKADQDLSDIYGDGREIVFVVDNGATMLEHWPIVVFVAETMVKKAAGLDKDGVDLRFTVDGAHHDKMRLRGYSGRKEFRAALNAAEPENSDGKEFQTDMYSTLDHIVRNWKKSGKPDTTLLILTDGKWGNTMTNLLDDTILQVAGEISGRHAGPRSFSIQFIRFGDDCADKLEKLDNTLCKDRGFRDIVDHCSWRSTVEKMFKGSILGQHDDDDPEELPINFDYQELVRLIRSFNNSIYHDRVRPTSTLFPPSSSRHSLSRAPSRSSNIEAQRPKRESAPPPSTETWQRHSRGPFSA